MTFSTAVLSPPTTSLPSTADATPEAALSDDSISKKPHNRLSRQERKSLKKSWKNLQKQQPKTGAIQSLVELLGWEEDYFLTPEEEEADLDASSLTDPASWAALEALGSIEARRAAYLAQKSRLVRRPRTIRDPETGSRESEAVLTSLRKRLMQKFGLESSEAEESCFQKAVPYAQLPTQHARISTQNFVREFFERGEKYAEKFTDQEASFLEHLCQLGCDEDTILLDLGCGNGTLAILASLVFGCHSVGVDRRTPHDNCRGELYFVGGNFDEDVKFTRMETCVSKGELIWEEIQKISQTSNRTTSKILIMCKHLCGAGSDHCIRFVEDLVGRTKTSSSKTFSFTGAVFTTCCTHKIPDPEQSGKDLRFYLDYYYSSSSDPNSSLSCVPCDKLVPEEKLFSQLCKWAAWRNTANCAKSRFSPEHDMVGSLVEDLVQEPRLRKLRKVVGEVRQIRFTPKSLQDRLVIARGMGASDGCWEEKLEKLLKRARERYAEKIPVRLREAYEDIE